jgi:hypothetical protein
MSPYLFVISCLLVIIFVIVSSLGLIYQTRSRKCIAYPNPSCYTDWTCRTADGRTENVYQTRLQNYLNSCGSTVKNPSASCPCVNPPDASISDPNAGNGNPTTWNSSEATKSAIKLCDYST